jgi:predicted nuclease of predicted toxin-antitoxin system
MKFLIDENVGESIVRFLVENGYDIVRAKDLSLRDDHSK